jgi:putative NIF3 family GTP cyclohydrolase 1 type 2
MKPRGSCVAFAVALLSVAGLGTPASAHSPGAAAPTVPTARQIIARIQQHVGVPWTEPTVDTFKAGDPDTPVTGIAVTMMATFDVLQRAAAAGKNLVITHEPTFYGHLDDTAALERENDAIFAAKQAFIRDHHLVIWRFRDFWHRRRPDGIMTGMVATLGWQKFQDADNPSLFRMPPLPLQTLAANLTDALHAQAVRIVGNPDLRVTKAALAPGAAGFARHRGLLQRDDVEVLVIGEAQEWETVEYVADAVAANKPKALIMLGHIPSEQAGMDECVRWLKTFITDVPIEFVPARDPFWRR